MTHPAETFLPIYDLTPFTLQDFPDRTAAIVWMAGCNMRCGYCHNPDIVKGKKGKITPEQALAFLHRRRGLLQGVVLSGGEATLYKGIIPFARDIKNMGFDIKLDTNGTRPAIIRQLLTENLLDFIALDYKAPQEKFKAVTALSSWKTFAETLDLLCPQKKVPVEIRTTVHTDLLDEHDVSAIIRDLNARGFTGKYYVQNFFSGSGDTLNKLEKQSRTLDISHLASSQGFATEYRNFWG